jgi:hypothetical protein
MFNLWDRDQLLVIISCVELLDDLLFVGEAEDTLKAIEELLQKVDPWDEYIERVLGGVDTLRGDSSLQEMRRPAVAKPRRGRQKLPSTLTASPVARQWQ